MADFLNATFEYISKIIDEDFLENLLADKNVPDNEQLHQELKKTKTELASRQMELNNLKIDVEGRTKVIQLLAESEADYRQKCESQHEELESLRVEMERLKMENAELKQKASNDLIPFDFGEGEYSEYDCLEGDLSEATDEEEDEYDDCDEYVLC